MGIVYSWIALWAHVPSGNSHCFSDSSDSPLAQLPLELCKGTVKESKTPQGYGQIEVLPNCSYLDLIMQIDANNEKQENVFENDGCRAKCMFVLPTMCEMGLLLWIS